MINKIRILFIKNQISYSLSSDIDKFKQWLLDIGLEAEFSFKNTNFELQFKDFGIKGLWGTEGTKDKIREANIVEFMRYDCVFFCYNVSPLAQNIANWTFPNNLVSGEAYSEIVYRENLVGLNHDIFIHEFLHQCQRLLLFRNIYIVDTLDLDNNRERILKIYQPLFGKMLAEYSLMQKLLIAGGFLNYLSLLLKRFFQSEPMPQPKQETIKEIIRRTATEANMSDRDYKDGLATLKAESGLNPLAKNVNRGGSVDRGIAQWNSKYWHQISDEEAYNPEKALKYFWDIFPKHKNWWSAYKNGTYKKFL